MAEDRDSRISDLYRQSSQETPPAHLDRAVMDMARRSVRRRVLSPFGNHWIAAGAMAGVVGLSVLLILTVPQQPDHYLPVEDAAAPSGETVPEAMKGIAPALESPLELYRERKEKREMPAAPASRFQSYEEMHDREVILQERDSGVANAPAASRVAPVPAGTYYLQAGAFRERQRALDLKEKLAGLGFSCEVQAISINSTDVEYRVRVGPFSDSDALEKARRKLGELGFETQREMDREQ